MKRFIAIVVLTLIAVAIAAPSFAKEKKAVVVAEEKAPRIARFVGRDTRVRAGVDMDFCEQSALNQADAWIRANYKKVRIISHSVTGNYHGRNYAEGGFSTVTILYQEK